jgi:catecholate siderophore receptor
MTLFSTASRAQKFLALSCIGSTFASAAMAQDAPRQAEPRALGSVTVTESVITENKGDRLESPKRTRPVRDTPQTITVLSKEVLEQQNLLTLRDALSTVPGITFGAGEGGGGYGDSINFRGYSANTDITVDGVRDSAQYVRTDPFNLEQIEVTNGANSVVSGAGSAGGSINIVTKRPLAKDQTQLSAGIGTDNYYRATVDANKRLSDLVAVRINGMFHRNDVPGRDVEDYKRWGIAPSVTIGIDNPTRLTLQYVHQEDNNIPQYGVPYYQSATNNGPVAGVGLGSYFGYRNVDKQKSTINQATAIFEHEFNDKVSIRNLARYQDVTAYTMVDPPQGTYCLNSGLTPTGATCAFPGYYQPSGPRGNTRDSRNKLAFDQIDLKAVFDTGPVEHTIDLGGAYTWEKFHLTTGNSLRNSNGTAVYTTFPLINIANPNQVVPGTSTTLAYGSNVYTGAFNYIESARQDGQLENAAAYLFDTMKLGKLELNAGLRLERNSGWYRADTVSTATATLGQVTRGAVFRNKDTLFSYRIGLVYKPIEPVSLYIAYGNSQTPSKTSVNGSCTDVTCNVDPESAKNYEIGAKAELFNGGLLLTAAAFRNERDKYKVASNDPSVPDQQLNGRSQVDGLSLGATGKITPNWSVTGNYTYLKGKLKQSVSDFCLKNPGSTGCGNSAAFPDPARGAQLANTPKNSGSIFTTYRLPFGLTVGYGATYQGSFWFGTPALSGSALTSVAKSKDYWVHSVNLMQEVTDRLSVQVNVKNFTDKVYYTRIRNNGWATIGDRRAAVLTVNYKM